MRAHAEPIPAEHPARQSRREGVSGVSALATLRSLQHAAGNSAVVRALDAAGHSPCTPVQRYLVQNVHQAAGAGPHFATQSQSAGLRTRNPAETPAGELPWEISHETTVASPSLQETVPVRVAEGLDLAVHDITGGEPKEFYCDRGVFERASERLEEVGSYFRLEWTSATIEVGEGENTKTLNRVVPVASHDAAARFAGGLWDECIEFARLVMGGVRQRQLPSIVASGQLYSESAARDLAQQVTPYGFGTDPVTAYSVARQEGALEGVAKSGLNEFAAPWVGESFNYTTLVSDKESAAELLPDGVWKFHFAGVVAISGEDRVTLENYKRSAESAVATLHAELIKRYRERTNVLVRQWHKLRYRGRYDAEFAPHGPAMKAVQRLVEKEAKQIGADGQREFARLNQDALRGNRWFFRMYGRRPGQSFHEQKVRTQDYGGRADQITMSVRGQSGG